MKLAIVGREERTRHLAPFNDEQYDILVLNESPHEEWCKKWDLLLEIHTPGVYQDINNPRYKDYWKWLQETRGKPIYMQKADPQVPDSVAFPLEIINREYLSTLKHADMDGTEHEQQYIRASVCYCIALGLHLGYDEIHVWGVELLDYAEYRSQQNNFAFWVGVATGRKVPVILHCCKGMFNQPLYGFEEFIQEDKMQRYLEDVNAQIEEQKHLLSRLEGAQMMVQLMLQEQKVKDKDVEPTEEKAA